jgi:hypothetical protein
MPAPKAGWNRRHKPLNSDYGTKRCKTKMFRLLGQDPVYYYDNVFPYPYLTDPVQKHSIGQPMLAVLDGYH